MTATAIVLLNQKGLETAKRIRSGLDQAIIWGLEGRVEGADKSFTDTGEHLRRLYNEGTPLIGIMATGILIRALAPALENKRAEPPVLAISDDGALIIPLLGGLTGANELARDLARKLDALPAITASGARHYALQLEAPPANIHLANEADAKRITSDILGGAHVQLAGHCAWLEDSHLPFRNDGEVTLRVSVFAETPPRNGLLYHPKTLLVEIEEEGTTAADIEKAFEETGLALPAIAAIVTGSNGPISSAVDCAAALQVPLRILDSYTEINIIRRLKLQTPKRLSLIELKSLPVLDYVGRSTGRLSIIGLGPGKAGWHTREVEAVLEEAEILVGYETYLNMVPKRFGQQRLASPNRVEGERAEEALNLAQQGHHVAVVSSGDPGIFAMASAVIERMDKNPVRWQHIEFEVLPGLSAMQGAAAKLGAPLGHDFAVISLSDILKPFEIIEKRLQAAASADMVIAIYNPASKTRRSQVEAMKNILALEKDPATIVVLAKNVGRDGEDITITSLAELDTSVIDMRTLIIIGSSKTRRIKGPNGRDLVYTPRTYSDES